MDYATLNAAIMTGTLAAVCLPHVHTNAMSKISGQEAKVKDQAIADILNASGTLTRLQSTHIGYGAVLALDPVAGAAILDGLEQAAQADSRIKWAMRLLDQGNLDIGSSATQATIDALVPAVFSAETAALLKSLGRVPETVSAADVSIALRGNTEYMPGEQT